MDILGVMREAKNVVFHPQYAQCLTATTCLPPISKHIYRSNIPNNRTVNSPNVSDALSNHVSEFLDL